MNTGKYSIPGVSVPVQPMPTPVQSEQPKIMNVDLKVVGVTFSNEDGSSRKAIILEMKGNEVIDLVREPENKYDANAIKVLADNRQIGYIGKEYATIMAPIMDNGGEFLTKIKGCGEFNKRPYCEITITQM
jgi:hypothetical protein